MQSLLKLLIGFSIMASFTSFSPNENHEVSLSHFDTESVLDIALPALPPSFSNCPPSDVNASYTPGVCGATVTWTPPTASADAINVTSNYSPGDSFLPGTTAVVYRAEDASGNIATCSFNVTVEDSENPVFDTFPSDVTLTADPNTCTAPHSWAEPTVSDNCPAGEGEAPVLQDFESAINQCYTFTRSTISNNGEINGTRNLRTTSISSIPGFTSYLTTPVFYFNGFGEITFFHSINALNDNPSIHLDVLDENGNVVVSDYYTEVYTDTGVQQEIIPFNLTGNYQLEISYSATRPFGTGLEAYLDDLLIPGTIVTNVNNTDCDLAEYVMFRSDGTGLNSGDQFDVGTTTIEYTVRDAAGNFTDRSFNITVENDVDPPSGSDEYIYCEGEAVPTMTVTVDTAAGESANWYNNDGDLVASNTTTYTPPASPDFFRNFLVYSQNSNGCSSEDFLSINLYQIPRPAPPAADSPVEYCIGETAGPLTASELSNHTLQWYTAASGGTASNTAPTPSTSAAGTTAYYVSQIDDSTGCESERTQIDVVVYDLPTAPTLVQDTVNYCIGDSAQQLDDYIQSGSNPTWYDAETGGNIVPGTTVPSTSSAGTTSYWVSQTTSSANCEGPRRRLTIIVHNPPVITTQPTNQEMCDGGTATFTADASNTSGFQWQYFNGSSWDNITDDAIYSNANTNTLTITGNPPRNQYRLVAQGFGGGCANAISNTASLTVNPAPATPTSGGDQTECEQNPIQTLTATATPPSGASVIWYDALTGGNVVTDPSLNTVGTETYYAESSDTVNGCRSTGRTAITLTIQSAPAAPISGGDQTECEENPIQTLTATATVPSGSTLVWYDAPTGGNLVANPDWSSLGTEIYYAESQDTATGCPSLTRTAVSLTIQAAPTAPISGGDQTECEQNPIQTLTATATAPGGSTLVWYDAPTAGNIVASPDWSTVGSITYYAESQNNTTSCPSFSRTPVTLTIDAIPVAPTSGGDQTECEQNPTQTMTATATAPSGSTVVWYTTVTGGSMVGSPTLNTIGTVTYYAESRTTSSGCVSETRTPVTLTMNPNPTIAVTPSSQTCSADLTTYSVSVDVDRGTVTSSEGTVTDNGGNNWTISAIPSGNDITVTVTDANSCTDVININAPNCACPTVNAPTSGGDQTECEQNPIQTLTATATAPAGASVVWYDTPTGGNVVSSPTWNTVGSTTYYAESVDDVNGCTSTTRTAVNLTIQPAPTAPTSAGDQTECEQNPIQTLIATASSAPGTSVTWYDSATGGNIVASPTLNTVGTVTYYAESENNSTNCVSHSRTAVNLTIDAAPTAPTSGGDQTECEQNPIQTLTATATAPSGSSVVWYDAASGGNIVASPNLNSVGTVTYFAESSDNSSSCASFTRTPVSLTIQNTPDITVSTAASCAPDLLTYSVSVDVSEGMVTSTEGMVVDNGGNNWTISGITSGNDITLTVTAPNACTQTLDITAPDCSCPIVAAPTSGGDQTECEQNPIQTLTATATPPADATVVWYDAPTGGSVVTDPSLSTTGSATYYAESRDNVTNCVSGTRTAVVLTIDAAPTAPTSGGDQTECEQNPIQTLTATATAPAGSTLIWYDAPTGGNIVASPTHNTVGTSTYYAQSENSTTSCTSLTRTAVSLTIEPAPSVPVSGGDQTECEQSPIQTLTATATAPTGSSIVWYDAATGGNVVASPTLNMVGSVTYFAESENNSTSCASFSRTPVSLTIEDTPDITVSTAATCAPDLLTYSVSVDVSEGTVTSTEGTVVDNGGNNWTISGVTAGNNITLTVTAPNACTQTLAVTAPDCSCPVVDAPISGGDQTECEQNPIQTLTATATPPTDATVVWYDAPTGGSVVGDPSLSIVGTIIFYAESVENVTNCISSTRTAVSLTIEATPADPISGGDQVECDANPTQTLTATATAPAGSSIVWYNAPTGGTIVATPILDTVGNVTYYAESSDDTSACTSFNRTAVSLTIHPLPNVVANATNTTINAGEPVTLTGSGATSYVWDNGVTDGDTVYPLATTTYTVIGTDGNSCENTDSVTITVNATSDIRIEKIVDDAAPNVGDTVTFTLTAYNDGPSDDIGGTVINDLLPSGYTYTGDTSGAGNGTYDAVSGDWTLPALTNGSSVAVDISASVNAPTATPNEYLNIAQVTSATNYDPDSTPNNDDGDQSEDDEASAEVVPQVADLEVTNTISQSSGNPGDTVVLTVTVQNSGPDDATNVSLENIVPVGFTVTTVNDAGTQSGNNITWSGLTIPNGTTTTLTYEATVNNPTNVADEYLNTVQVTTVDQYDPDSAPNNDDGDQSEDDEDAVSMRLQSSDLEIVNTVNPDSGNPGDTLTFSIEIINNSTDDATGIALENYVPSGFTVTTINNGGIQTGNTISWNGLTVPSGTSETVTFEVTINVPTNTDGEYFNSVQVTAVDQLDPDSSPDNDDGDQSEDDEDNAEIVLIPADLSLSKNLSAASNPTPNAGDTVTFEVTVTNDGPGIATNVSIEDVLPVGYTLGTVNNFGVVSGNTITWPIATLAVGSQTVSYEVTLNAPTNAIGEYDNTAQVMAMDQFDPDSTPNNDDGDQSEDDETNYTIDAPTVDLEVAKIVNKDQTFYGDTVVFTVTVTNNSEYVATNVGIEDVLPSGYTLVSHTSDLGQYDESIFSWDIPAIEIDQTATLEMTVTVNENGQYTNIAELMYVDQIDPNTSNDRAEATPEITQSQCLTVYNEFSPNDDGTNDIFYIECIEQFPNNTISVYNRWGAMVFSMNGYDNSWDGKSINKSTLNSTEKLPVGTYYYTLDPGDGSTTPKSGWLYISR
ncbi:gliding motility-associated C-terminal domain-containing protein [Pseudozobellia sp. WGM2]|uniref:Ig-like domain-containing protein n=1 Tax=Pseudozobellia sp. WGM2 TaxID=2787625 RepID=UPI001ADEC75B|nr:gliding motility-associated C-terminal domain-containing protein [Pseudozobellia sp. WGM2]